MSNRKPHGPRDSVLDELILEYGRAVHCRATATTRNVASIRLRRLHNAVVREARRSLREYAQGRTCRSDSRQT